MKKYYEDRKYLSIVNDILEHNEFQKLGDICHHGDNRLEHSIRVSYCSYKVCKFLHLDSKKVARAGLLHDFFFQDNQALDKKERLKVLVNHPLYACSNAKKYFELSELEEDIITTHMFPIGKRMPKYLESWIVDIVDDLEAVYEKTRVVSRQLSASMSFIFLLLINNLR